MDEIRKLLNEEIKAEIRELSNLSLGTDEKTTAINDLAKLYKLRIEETKNELDFEEKREKRLMESEQYKIDVTLKEKQIDNDAAIKQQQFKADFAEKSKRRAMEKEHHKTEMKLKEKQIDSDVTIKEQQFTADFTEKGERRAMEKEHHRIEMRLKEKQIDGDIDYHDDDKQLKEAQLREQVRDRYFKVGVEIAGVVLPLIFYAVWMKKGLKFEETGTYTSTTFKGLFGRFKPTKK